MLKPILYLVYLIDNRTGKNRFVVKFNEQIKAINKQSIMERDSQAYETCKIKVLNDDMTLTDL